MSEHPFGYAADGHDDPVLAQFPFDACALDDESHQLTAGVVTFNEMTFEIATCVSLRDEPSADDGSNEDVVSLIPLVVAYEALLGFRMGSEYVRLVVPIDYIVSWSAVNGLESLQSSLLSKPSSDRTGVSVVLAMDPEDIATIRANVAPMVAVNRRARSSSRWSTTELLPLRPVAEVCMSQRSYQSGDRGVSRPLLQPVEVLSEEGCSSAPVSVPSSSQRHHAHEVLEQCPTNATAQTQHDSERKHIAAGPLVSHPASGPTTSVESEARCAPLTPSHEASQHLGEQPAQPPQPLPTSIATPDAQGSKRKDLKRPQNPHQSSFEDGEVAPDAPQLLTRTHSKSKSKAAVALPHSLSSSQVSSVRTPPMPVVTQRDSRKTPTTQQSGKVAADRGNRAPRKDLNGQKPCFGASPVSVSPVAQLTDTDDDISLGALLSNFKNTNTRKTTLANSPRCGSGHQRPLFDFSDVTTPGTPKPVTIQGPASAQRTDAPEQSKVKGTRPHAHQAATSSRHRGGHLAPSAKPASSTSEACDSKPTKKRGRTEKPDKSTKQSRLEKSCCADVGADDVVHHPSQPTNIPPDEIVSAPSGSGCSRARNSMRRLELTELSTIAQRAVSQATAAAYQSHPPVTDNGVDGDASLKLSAATDQDMCALRSLLAEDLTSDKLADFLRASTKVSRRVKELKEAKRLREASIHQNRVQPSPAGILAMEAAAKELLCSSANVRSQRSAAAAQLGTTLQTVAATVGNLSSTASALLEQLRDVGKAITSLNADWQAEQDDEAAANADDLSAALSTLHEVARTLLSRDGQP